MPPFNLLLAADGGWGPFILAIVLSAAVGAAVVWAYFNVRGRRELADKAAAAARELEDARRQRDEILREAEVEAQKKLLETMKRFEAETAETREELKQTERRLAKRQDTLDKQLEVLDTKERKIEEAEQRVAQREAEVAEKQKEVDTLAVQHREELLRVAKLTEDEARAQCLQRIEREVQREAGQLIEKILLDAQENAREQARKITIEAIQRFAADHTCEATVATVDVPSDDMKGRIIGREGRNIRAFEKATGVTVIVDDTPGIVSISCFDPVRKEVARLALERLIKDGRIHPTRIEELVEQTSKEVDEQIAEAGKQAALETNIHGLHKKIIEKLGALQFRTSYGQNVLRHSIEVAHLCGIMADELGLDGQLARRCGLLHDIGKALDHDQEGTHTKLGAEFCKKFNEHPAVINAVAGHHGDIAATHPYTPLVTAADAVSASRPGGRRESLERYIKRLEELEGIAKGFEGVRLAYAVEAGREVRVIVDAVRVDDRSALKLARDIAQKIEHSMTYPGEIKVTVLREIRATEYAR
ncbi:MAG: ribonuclease Y [Planctomycetota bacterium]|nr:MAG: ribonuclease Y [Planctomycetota bacterium]